MKRHLSTLALAVVLTIVAATAWAYWTTGSVAGGGGAAAASSVGQGATPTASVAGQAVTLSWAPSTLSSGEAVDGYLVTRYDAVTLAPQTILTACTGTVTATSCVESDVPNGSWKYTVTPVFATSWQGPESATSASVAVDYVPDTTAPSNAISLSSVSGGAYLSGTSLFYRGASAGSLHLTNAVADSDSGPASSETAALTGTTTGWTHSPSTVSSPAGGPYVSASFDWAAGTTSGPGEEVTGRDVAGNTATTNLTFTNDSTAPGAGSISYPDGASGRSVSVSFTSGTDAGSGVSTRRLQRATATLTDNACGSFGSFTDLGTDSPTSPYVDSSLDKACYKYRYVVTDRVGNQDVATSGNVVKVGYYAAVTATSGLLSYWRLGESATGTTTSSDTFTGTAGTLLTAHTGELAATWVRQAGTADETISNENRVYRTSLFGGYSINYASLVPTSADYTVEADLVSKSALAGDMVGVIGRLNTTATTFYMARWEQADTSWNLVKVVNGTPSYLGYVASQPALTVGQAYRIKLVMNGSSLGVYVNGDLKVSATDTSITAAGRAGIMDGDSGFLGTNTAKTNTTGIHLDNFQVTAVRATDSVGTNHGAYVNGVTLGATGALAGDSNTAAQFDGVNDYVQMTGTTGIPVGANNRSVEAWFKTSSSARQVLFDYGSLTNTQEFGLWIDAGGTTMTAWGWGTGNDRQFTMPSAVNNGAWHQVVLTYNGATLTLYIDGIALPTQAATRNTVMNSYGFGIGAVITPGDGNSGGYFNGSIDEVSFYTSVLDQATVTAHHQLGGAPSGDTSGPTGGSVDASGLVGTGSRYSTSTALSLVLAKGSDSSGVATSGNQVLRASATLTNGSCGTFGSYSLVSGGTDPTSPLTDSVDDGACYSYQYVVLDTLGNATTYTSPSIKVDTTAPAAPTFSFTAFTNTYWPGSGATVYYRSAAGSGSFTTTATTTDASGIASYTYPDLGSNWTSTPGALGVTTYSWSGAPAAPGTQQVTATNNATLTSAGGPITITADDNAPTGGSVTYAGGVTTSTTVSVSFTAGTDSQTGIGTRLLQRASAPLTGTTCGTFGSFATVTNGTNPTSPLSDQVATGSCYRYQYVVADGVGNLATFTSGSTLKVSATYAGTITGTSGLYGYWRLGEASGTSAVDSKGTNNGTYTNGPTLAQTGGLAGDANTAVRFDGTNDYVSIARQIADDFSIEFWFKSTQGLGTNAQWWGNAGLVDAEVSGGFNDFGVSLRSDGKVVAGVGTPDVSIVSSSGGYNNGAWHHVVFTRTRTTGALALYVDGASAGTATGAANTSLNTPAFINFGRIQAGGNYLAGTLDEVAIYNTVLSGATVSAHHSAGATALDTAGPTGGSVDATGLVGAGSRYSTSTTLSLVLAKGSDPSGVATTGNQVLRAAASLTDGTCGTFGGYSLVSGGNDPESPLADSVDDEACYSYQYVVQDTLGNATTYTSPSIKVDTTAPAAPSLTFSAFTNASWPGTGATVYYRSAATSGSFTATGTASDASGIASYAYPGLGTNWSSTPGASGVNTYSWSGAPAAPGTSSVTATNNAGGTSPGATFTLVADDTAPTPGTIAYPDTSQSSLSVSVDFTTGTDDGSGLGTRLLQRAQATLTGTTCGTFGSFTTITNGTNPAASPVTDTVIGGSCYRYQYVVADQVGNTHTATSPSIVKVSSPYLATVLATTGLLSYWRLGESSGATSVTDSKGTNTGTYVNSPTMGVAGAIAGDASTAVTFNGTNQYATVTRQIADDFSIEFWFKSTQGIGTGTQWWSGAGLVDAEVGGGGNDFGVSLRSDGRILAGVGAPDTSIVTTGSYHNGAWHHVVFTRTRSSGALALYVDGVAAGTATGNTVSLTGPANINFGRIQSATNYFAGSLDEVALYTTPVSAATALAHYNAGH